ncbi:hypothetical protein ACQ4PT_058635 [Festuca glaucescens]
MTAPSFAAINPYDPSTYGATAVHDMAFAQQAALLGMGAQQQAFAQPNTAMLAMMAAAMQNPAMLVALNPAFAAMGAGGQHTGIPGFGAQVFGTQGLAKQLPKRVLLQQLLVLPVIRLRLLGRVKCPVLRLAFRMAIDITSLASAGREFRPSEKIKLFGFGKGLEEDISLSMPNVRPNSILHVVRTEVHLFLELPGEDRVLRPPGAFRWNTVRRDLYYLKNAGMGARLCTYYQKTSPTDQTATSLRATMMDWVQCLLLSLLINLLLWETYVLGLINHVLKQTCIQHLHFLIR